MTPASTPSDTLTPLGTLADPLADLFDEAVSRFGTRCLWNVRPQRTVDGLLLIADRLRKYGDMEAWRLASRIRDCLESAPR